MNKGFTLIELLAVIVILAIIALIATPIVLNIIDDSEKSSTIRSAEFYIDAVQNKIMQKNIELGGMLNPKQCLINEGGNVTCDGTNIEIEVDGEKPISGYITFENGRLIAAEVGFTGSTIVNNSLGEYVSLEDDIICVSATEETKTTGNVPKNNFEPGDEYICEVKKGTKYRFFVLSVEEDNVNLILDRNINSDGTLVTTKIGQENAVNGRYNIVAWMSEDDYKKANTDNTSCTGACTDEGPISAMNFLYNATKDWNKVPSIEINYEDNYYGGIKTTNSITKITRKDGTTVTAQYDNLKARMPSENELNGDGKCADKIGSCPLWLSNYLNSSSYVTGEGLKNIKYMYGYWLLSSSSTSHAWYTAYLGQTYNATGVYTLNFGVRPVISIPKFNIK